jgi:CubicO group peptidase (beta-lactamase class C family)
MNRRTVLALPLLALPLRPAFAAGVDTANLDEASVDALRTILDRAEALSPLRSVVVAQGGREIAARGYHGGAPNRPTNIKSASKSVMSALVGIAIDRGVLEGTEQKIAPLLQRDLPDNPDPRMDAITIGNLLSMQAGLARMSGPNYGRWVSSRNWVRAALAAPFDDEPGGAMLYSTASTHLLSAILTRVTGRTTRALADDWLRDIDGFAITSWDRDPQGLYLGGNQMAMSPRSLLAFGELFRNGGRNAAGKQIVSEAWITASWTPRTASRFTGDGYGYGWFLRDIAGAETRYAWGYGGQMLYIVPSRGLTVAMTSDESAPAGRSGHRDALHALLGEILFALPA